MPAAEPVQVRTLAHWVIVQRTCVMQAAKDGLVMRAKPINFEK